MASGPTSIGSKPRSDASDITVAFAASSSPATGIISLPPPWRLSAILLAPVVLKALTTRAPGASRATVSPAESSCPTASEKSGVSGLVASMTIFPASEPSSLAATVSADQGTASTRISPAGAASLTGTMPKPCCLSAAAFSPVVSRSAMVTLCPRLRQPAPRARPTFPAPTMTMFMAFPLNRIARSGSIIAATAVQ